MKHLLLLTDLVLGSKRNGTPPSKLSHACAAQGIELPVPSPPLAARSTGAPAVGRRLAEERGCRGNVVRDALPTLGWHRVGALRCSEPQV